MGQVFTLTIPNMKCAGCAASVKKALTDQHVANVDVDISNKTIQVSTTLQMDQVAKHLEEAGYPACELNLMTEEA